MRKNYYLSSSSKIGRVKWIVSERTILSLFFYFNNLEVLNIHTKRRIISVRVLRATRLQTTRFGSNFFEMLAPQRRVYLYISFERIWRARTCFLSFLLFFFFYQLPFISTSVPVNSRGLGRRGKANFDFPGHRRAVKNPMVERLAGGVESVPRILAALRLRARSILLPLFSSHVNSNGKRIKSFFPSLFFSPFFSPRGVSTLFVGKTSAAAAAPFRAV